MEHYKFCPKCAGNLIKKKVNHSERLACEKCGFIFYQNPKPTVSIFVIDKGKILLGERTVEPYKGWWNPIGGFVEEGESLQEAAEREDKEEAGVEIELLEMFGAGKDIYGDQHIIPVGFIGKLKRGVPQDQEGEDVVGWRWFELADLPENIAFETTRNALEFLSRRRRARSDLKTHEKKL